MRDASSNPSDAESLVSGYSCPFLPPFSHRITRLNLLLTIALALSPSIETSQSAYLGAMFPQILYQYLGIGH